MDWQWIGNRIAHTKRLILLANMPLSAILAMDSALSQGLWRMAAISRIYYLAVIRVKILIAEIADNPTFPP